MNLTPTITLLLAIAGPILLIVGLDFVTRMAGDEELPTGQLPAKGRD